MPNFKYKAVDNDGKYVKGKINADNHLNLESVLSEYGLDLISWVEEKNRLSGLFVTKIKTRDMITMLLLFANETKNSIHDAGIRVLN